MGKVTCSFCHTDTREPLVIVDGLPYHNYHQPAKTRKLEEKQQILCEKPVLHYTNSGPVKRVQ